MRLLTVKKEEVVQLQELAGKYDNPVLLQELQERVAETKKRLHNLEEQIELLRIPVGRRLASWLSGGKKSHGSDILFATLPYKLSLANSSVSLGQRFEHHRKEGVGSSR